MYTLTTICILYHVTVSWPSGLMGSNPQIQIQSTNFTKSLYKRHRFYITSTDFHLGDGVLEPIMSIPRDNCILKMCFHQSSTTVNYLEPNPTGEVKETIKHLYRHYPAEREWATVYLFCLPSVFSWALLLRNECPSHGVSRLLNM